MMNLNSFLIDDFNLKFVESTAGLFYRDGLVDYLLKNIESTDTKMQTAALQCILSLSIHSDKFSIFYSTNHLTEFFHDKIISCFATLMKISNENSVILRLTLNITLNMLKNSNESQLQLMTFDMPTWLSASLSKNDEYIKSLTLQAIIEFTRSGTGTGALKLITTQNQDA